MNDQTLYEVRCPNTRWKGNTNNVSCNSLCGKITNISMGEFWCRKCKIIFNFIINDEGEVGYFNYEQTPVEKRHDNKTAEGRLLNLLEE